MRPPTQAIKRGAGAAELALALALAILPGSAPARAGQIPDPNVLLSRTFLDVTPGADFQAGNYEHRRDRFANTSTQQVLVLAGVEVKMLNPEDLGFADLEPANVTAVVAAARVAYPEYPFWGTSFWNYAGGVPPLDVPPVAWVFSEFPGTTFPVELDPGESFVLQTRSHNSLLGPVDPPPERIGELIIGWRFLTARCGNEVVEDAEECDDGNAVDDDGCRNDCTIPVCGDGILDTVNEEECDDGNGIDADGCRNNCTIPFCGDFLVDPQNGETCDPPGTPSGVHQSECRGDCTVCGDAILDSAEDCDDGNVIDEDGCRNDCTVPVCGDGILDAINEEDCDDGNPIDDDGCRNDCTIPFCGDGIVDNINEEECDDGNRVDDDGCRNDCTIPVCGDFIVDAQNDETCDPPGVPSGAIGNDCRLDCTVCGDGVVDAAEECDDGNASETDNCRNDCTERGIITRNADGANSVVVSDVDGDGDFDVVSASGNDDKIAWHENLDTTGDGFGDGVVWVEHLVTDLAIDARFVTAGPLGFPQYALPKAGKRPGVEVEGPPDGGLLVAGKYGGDWLLSASFQDNTIRSYENLFGDGLMWVERIVSSEVNGASSVHVVDLNEDGCLDVLATGATDGTVVWFADLMCDGLTWSPPNVIDSGLGGARDAVGAPLNPDQSIDVLAVGFDANSVVAYLNGGAGTAFSPVVISDVAFGATSIAVGDFDFDGDFDAVVATSGDDSITWFENVDNGKTAGDGTIWAPHVVSSAAGGASAVYAVDLDFDRDDDILAAAADDGTITWFENAAGDGSVWIPHTLGTSSPGASSVKAADLNGDFQADVVASSFDNDTVAWFENQEGLFPGPCGNGELNAFETCDPPGSPAGGNGNLCRADCTVCGDAVVDPGEDCDDGNGVDAGDQCNNSCTSGAQPTAGRSRAASG